jgi:hypothetical protein
LPGVVVSTVCTTRHHLPGSTSEFWTTSPPADQPLSVKCLALGRLGDALEHGDLPASFVARLDLRQVFGNGDDLPSESGGSRRRPRSKQCRGLIDCAVTIDAINLDCGARLVVKVTVAVHVRAHVAIGAVHAHLLMHVFQMNRFFEFFGSSGLIFAPRAVSIFPLRSVL